MMTSTASALVSGFPRRFKIEVSDDPEFGAARSVEDKMYADQPNPGVTPQTVQLEVNSARFVRFTATKLAERKDDYIFALGELMVLDPNGENVARGAKVTALDSIEAPARWQKKNLVDGYYFGVETNAETQESWKQLAARRESLLAKVASPEAQAKRLAIEDEILSIRKTLASLPKPQSVYAAATNFPAVGSFVPPERPRLVHFLRRGDVKNPGEEMKPGAIAALPVAGIEFGLSLATNESARRVQLAKWITSTNNMLTRRSIVNRVWAYHFGRGLVETPNDFGRMGALPVASRVAGLAGLLVSGKRRVVEEVASTHRDECDVSPGHRADVQNLLRSCSMPITVALGE